MRTNREMTKEWSDKIRYCDDYNIEIFIMRVDDEITLNVWLDLDGETMYDSECVMVIENTAEPTNEMKKKFKSLAKYFKQHFENVNAIEEIVEV